MAENLYFTPAYQRPSRSSLCRKQSRITSLLIDPDLSGRRFSLDGRMCIELRDGPANRRADVTHCADRYRELQSICEPPSLACWQRGLHAPLRLQGS